MIHFCHCGTPFGNKGEDETNQMHRIVKLFWGLEEWEENERKQERKGRNQEEQWKGDSQVEEEQGHLIEYDQVVWET